MKNNKRLYYFTFLIFGIPIISGIVVNFFPEWIPLIFKSLPYVTKFFYWFIIGAIGVFVLGTLFYYFKEKWENLKKCKKTDYNTEIEYFFEKYLNELSEKEISTKINEIANINSQYPISDKKIAQALFRFYNKLNN